MTVAEFIAKWRHVDLKERSAAQEHFLDLCHLLGHPTPAEADPTGERFCFEKGIAKHGGGDGFADVWKKGFFGWEYKGKHKDLNAAYNQLLLYRDALASPPLLVLCDLDRIIVHTNFTNTVSARHEIALEQLGEPRNIEILRAVFFDPEKLRPGQTSEAVTRMAAEQIAGIAESMRGRDLDEVTGSCLKIANKDVSGTALMRFSIIVAPLQMRRGVHVPPRPDRQAGAKTQRRKDAEAGRGAECACRQPQRSFFEVRRSTMPAPTRHRSCRSPTFRV